MRTSFTILTTVIFIGYLFTDIDNTLQSNLIIKNEIKNIHEFEFSDPPLFTETIKTFSEDNGNKPCSNEIDQSWYQKTLENIEKEEYSITYNEETGFYQSPNRSNNIRFIYHKDGFTAKTRSVDLMPIQERFKPKKMIIENENKKIDEWEIKFKIKSFNKTSTAPLYQSEEQRGFLQNGSTFTAAGNKAHIEYDNIRIDYTNDKNGMRQDFIIKKRPAGEGKLRLNFSADTKLKMIVGADALMFKNSKGQDKMKYSSLNVWDANGSKLRAYFEKSGPNSFCIDVNYVFSNIQNDFSTGKKNIDTKRKKKSYNTIKIAESCSIEFNNIKE